MTKVSFKYSSRSSNKECFVSSLPQKNQEIVSESKSLEEINMQLREHNLKTKL